MDAQMSGWIGNGQLNEWMIGWIAGWTGGGMVVRKWMRDGGMEGWR